MNFSLKRTFVLAKLKAHNLYINQMVTVSLFIPILIAAGGLLFYKKVLGGITIDDKQLLLLNASLVNIVYLGIYIPAVLMAEEKEKNTLRVLMVSSITGLEYFIGVLMPNLLLMTGIQLLLLPLLEISVSLNALLIYTGISLVAVFISNVIGMSFGLILKDQMSATLAPIPLIFLIWMIPLFGNLNSTMEFISSLFYSSMISRAVSSLVYQTPFTATNIQWITFVLEVIIAIIVFLMLYRKNGYESD